MWVATSIHYIFAVYTVTAKKWLHVYMLHVYIAREDSFRAHRTILPWTHILAKPVSDGVSPVVPCPQALACALKFAHVG